MVIIDEESQRDLMQSFQDRNAGEGWAIQGGSSSGVANDGKVQIIEKLDDDNMLAKEVHGADFDIRDSKVLQDIARPSLALDEEKDEANLEHTTQIATKKVPNNSILDKT